MKILILQAQDFWLWSFLYIYHYAIISGSKVTANWSWLLSCHSDLVGTPICKNFRILLVFWKTHKPLPNYLLITKSLESPKLSPCHFPKYSTCNESKLLIAKSSNKKISNIAWVLPICKKCQVIKNSQVFAQLPINN